MAQNYTTNYLHLQLQCLIDTALLAWPLVAEEQQACPQALTSYLISAFWLEISDRLYLRWGDAYSAQGLLLNAWGWEIKQLIFVVIKYFFSSSISYTCEKNKRILYTLIISRRLVFEGISIPEFQGLYHFHFSLPNTRYLFHPP